MITERLKFPAFGTLYSDEPLLAVSARQATDLVRALPGRPEVLRLEQELLKLPQQEIPVDHFFGDGVYVRKIFIPKGTVATGRIHKYDHVSIVISGRMTVWVEGAGVHEVVGPCITEVKAGTKRAGYAHEDTIWATAHQMDRLEEGEIVDFLTVGTYEEFEMFCRNSGERMLPCQS